MRHLDERTLGTRPKSARHAIDNAQIFRTGYGQPNK